MDAATQTVASAMEAYVKAQEITARNVANVATPGFKRNIAMFENVAGESEGTEVPTVTQVSLDLSQGSLTPTYNALDLAVKGDGFFTVQGPDGFSYTRNGSFRLDENRILVTQQGHPVLGESGEIQIPDGGDQIVVGSSGDLSFGDVMVGKLRITTFQEPGMLRQKGSGEFNGDQAGPQAALAADVRQGYLEASNVKPVAELVRMMSTLRDYEGSARSLKAIEDSASKLYAWART